MAHRSAGLWIKGTLAVSLVACALAAATLARSGQPAAAVDRPGTLKVAARHEPDLRRGTQTDLLLTVIRMWLATNFDLPADADLPRVVFVPAREIAELRWGPGADPNAHREVVAVYHDKRNAIYLPEGWTGGTPAEVSVVVHEMVHHLQKRGGHKFLCPEARERAAYDAQEKWLALFGLSLLSEFQIDPFTVKVATACL